MYFRQLKEKVAKYSNQDVYHLEYNKGEMGIIFKPMFFSDFNCFSVKFVEKKGEVSRFWTLLMVRLAIFAV